MIFVTIGTQLPFDRLIKAVDDIAFRHPELAFYAQIGQGSYKPKNMEFSRFLSSAEFESKVNNCDYIVAHAGMGSVLTALKYRKPLIAIPRESKLGEHRNDHQLATASQLKAYEGMYITSDIVDLEGFIESELSPPDQQKFEKSRKQFRDRLNKSIEELIS